MIGRSNAKLALAFIGMSLAALCPAHGQDDAGGDLLKHGEYLTRAADCEACHTVPGQGSFIGGRAFTLPFGVLFSPNITPDKETGIGDWSDDDFVRALHDGVGKGGKNLYPAFPYASYTQMSREDALAIKAYLFSLPAVHAPPKENSLVFPFNQRWGMIAWNLINLDDRRFQPDASQSSEWNRGNYLANVLGHCGECHTPRTVTYGLSGSKAFAGGEIEGWHAYNLTSDKEYGIGKWSDAALDDYLSSGHGQGRGSAAGPMEEVVRLSLSHLSEDDIHALGTYLKSLPPQSSAGDPAINDSPPALQNAAYVPSSSPTVGQKIFEGSCASCHGFDGGGLLTDYASLKGTGAVSDPKATNLVRVVLDGASARTDSGDVRMPAFAASMTDTEVASVANYVTDRFGGRGANVTPDDVAKARHVRDPPTPPDFKKWGALAAVVILLVVAALGLAFWRRRHAPRLA